MELDHGVGAKGHTVDEGITAVGGISSGSKAVEILEPSDRAAALLNSSTTAHRKPYLLGDFSAPAFNGTILRSFLKIWAGATAIPFSTEEAFGELIGDRLDRSRTENFYTFSACSLSHQLYILTNCTCIYGKQELPFQIITRPEST